MAKYQRVCVVCSKSFFGSRPTVKTCSRVCMGKNLSGSNNPNFGNKWSSEQRHTASALKKEHFKNNPDYAYQCGKSNRGAKFSEDRIRAMHGHREISSYKHTHSEETKKIIGIKSKEKFTTEFKEKFRRTMEENGQWVKLDEKDPYDNYYKEANWIESMVDFFDDDSKKILREVGMFSRSNSKGWVRDHIVPRMVGYEFSLPPQILRHPCNLQFIPHSKNVAKGFADRKLTHIQKSDIIEQLKKRILEHTSNWKEHEWCVEYIRNMK